MFKEKFGKHMIKILYVGIFIYFLFDNKNVDVKCLQTLRCILCYNSPILFCNPKIQARKGLIIYNTTNGITTTLKKHVNLGHFIIAKNVCGGSK
jgi:hypothetical protein